MLTKLARARAQAFLNLVAGLFLRLGFSPNALTVLGFLLILPISGLIAVGQEALGAFLLIFAFLFDAVDGSAARLANRESRFGAFLDSTLDRWAEAALYLALLVRGYQRQDLVFVVLVFVAFAGSVMVSYARARAEGLGIECKEGLLTRFERLALLILGLLLTAAWGYTPLVIAVGFIGVFANVTAVQRILYVHDKLE